MRTLRIQGILTILKGSLQSSRLGQEHDRYGHGGGGQQGIQNNAPLEVYGDKKHF